MRRLLQQRLKRIPSNVTIPPQDEEEVVEEERSESGRLIIVANRLPVSARRAPDGSWQLQASAGGLVSALLGVKQVKTVWIGWPGIWVPPGPERDALTETLLRELILFLIAGHLVAGPCLASIPLDLRRSQLCPGVPPRGHPGCPLQRLLQLGPLVSREKRSRPAARAH